MSAQPQNASPWERILTKYGAATAIALFMVYWLTSGVSGDVRTLREDVKSHISETNFYLRAICVNVATTEGQRANCIIPR